MKLMAAWRQRGAGQASCGRTRREVETGECGAGPWLPPQACAPGVARKKLCYGIFCSSPYGKPAARWGRSFLPLAAPTAPTKPCTGCLWRAAKGLAPRRAHYQAGAPRALQAATGSMSVMSNPSSLAHFQPSGTAQPQLDSMARLYRLPWSGGREEQEHVGGGGGGIGTGKWFVVKLEGRLYRLPWSRGREGGIGTGGW